MMTPRQYFWIEEDEHKKQHLTRCAQRMAPVIAGQLKWRNDGGDLHITGMFQGRPARIVLSVAFATADLELKMAAPMTLRQNLVIQIDRDAIAPTGEPLDRDEWDEWDNTSQKLFFAPHVFVEGGAAALQAMRAMIERLSQPGRNALLSVLSSYDRGGFSVDGSTVEISCPSSVTLDDDVARLVSYNFNMLLMLSNEMAQVWS